MSSFSGSPLRGRRGLHTTARVFAGLPVCIIPSPALPPSYVITAAAPIRPNFLAKQRGSVVSSACFSSTFRTKSAFSAGISSVQHLQGGRGHIGTPASRTLLQPLIGPTGRFTLGPLTFWEKSSFPFESSDTRVRVVICWFLSQLPQILKVLSGSFNPHVRYGAALALGLACAGSGQKDVVDLLLPLANDSTDFVRQGTVEFPACISPPRLSLEKRPAEGTRRAGGAYRGNSVGLESASKNHSNTGFRSSTREHLSSRSIRKQPFFPRVTNGSSIHT